MRNSCFCLLGAMGLLMLPRACVLAQVSTNEGGYDVDEELRDLNERMQALESQQAERVERELSSLRAQLREARRLEQIRVARPHAVKTGEGPPQTTTERIASDPARRYRYYQGRWWYWRPSKAWAVYDQDRWITYPARTAGR